MATRAPIRDKQRPLTLIESVGDREAVIPIEGMTCASCVQHVEKALAKVPGVQAANVNLATERATVSYDPAQTSVEQLAAVEKAGYGVGPLPEEAPEPSVPSQELSLPIEGMTCASCVRHVERALERVPGVQSVSVNLATERATVAFDPAQAGVD